MGIWTKKAAKHGRIDAQTFASENPDEVQSVAERVGLEGGADDALISAVGVDEVARLFGLARSGTARFEAACRAYSRAYDAEIVKIATREG